VLRGLARGGIFGEMGTTVSHVKRPDKEGGYLGKWVQPFLMMGGLTS